MAFGDKPRAVENTPEKINRIVDHLKKFSGRRGYPDTEQGFEALVDAVADIIYDKPNGSLWNHPTIKINSALGPIDNDLDWLMKRAYRELTFCPMPPHFRAMYCQNFIPADGIQIAIDLEDL